MRRLGREGEGAGEAGAAAVVVREEGEGAALERDELRGDAEAEADRRLAACRGVREAGEGREDVGGEGVGDAGAGVLDRERPVGADFDAHRSALGRELDGVGDEVVEHLPRARRVGADADLVAGGVEGERLPLGGGASAVRGGDVAREGDEVDRLGAHAERAALHERGVEHAVDELARVARDGSDDRGELGLDGAVGEHVAQGVGVALHGGEGAAEVVRGHPHDMVQARRRLHEPLAGGEEAEFVGGDAGEVAQELRLGGGEAARLGGDHADGAEGVAVGRAQRRTGVEANAPVGGDERVVGEAHVERGVLDDEHVAVRHHVRAEREVARQHFGHVGDAREERLHVFLDDCHERLGRADHGGGHAGDAGEALVAGVVRAEPLGQGSGGDGAQPGGLLVRRQRQRRRGGTGEGRRPPAKGRTLHGHRRGDEGSEGQRRDVPTPPQHRPLRAGFQSIATSSSHLARHRRATTRSRRASGAASTGARQRCGRGGS